MLSLNDTSSRYSGILLPIASLPSPFGVGNFGKESYRYIDMLASNGFSLWQILPLNPLGYGHSPYQPLSSYAIDEIYTDLDDLKRRGFLTKVPSLPLSDHIDYEKARETIAPFLKEAYRNAKDKEKENIHAFTTTHPWVKEWAIYSYNKKRNGLKAWNEWENAKDFEEFDRDDLDEYYYEIWVQMNLFREWKALKAHANRKGIRIIGDLPFYIGYDSADVYAHLEMFEIDPISKEPVWVAGVPPDYFSEDGQRWGNPIYRWDLLEKNGFSFLIDRFKGSAELYDIIRIDHFRAFDTYWRIPASSLTAKEGKWIEAPGYKFFEALKKERTSFNIIAEDLGDLRPEVLKLRDYFSFPGMEVIEFDFDDVVIKGIRKGFDRKNSLIYTGTHDNDTLRAYLNELGPDTCKKWRLALKEKGFLHDDLIDSVLEFSLSLPASFVIFPLQDVLGLDNEARLNRPGTINDINWTWRLASLEAVESRLAFIGEYNKKYHRIPNE